MSFVSAAYRIEAELAGDYATVVKADAPVGYWRLGDREGYAQAVLSDAPVGYWRMDAPSGTSETDRSTGGHNGTYSGGFTLNQAGALSDGDTSAALNGAAAVDLGNVAGFAFTGAFSVEVFAKWTAASVGFVVTKNQAAGNGWTLNVNASGQVGVWAYTAAGVALFNVSSSSAFNDGAFHHIVASWDGTTNAGGVAVYVDGVRVVTAASAGGTPGQPAVSCYVGRQGDTTGGSFIGTVDEVALYNYKLSAQQIANHYALRTSTIATVAAATVADSSGNGNTGTVSGGVTLQQATNQPDLDTAALCDGTSGYVSVFGAGCRITGALTVEAWVKLPSAPTGFSIVARCGATGDVIYALLITSALKLFYQHSPDGTTFLNAASTATLATGVYQHVAVVRNAAGTSVSFYLNGAFVDTIALAAAPQAAAFQTTYLGGSFLLNQMLGGTLDEVAVYSYALTAAQLQAHYLAGFWTSLGLDVCKAPGPHWTRGNTSNGPLDHVAGTGTLEFAVRNDARNTGSTEGWYSPNHASCRPGWGYGIPVRLVSTYQSVALGDGAPVDRVLWRGKITTLLPDAGKYGPRQVHVTAQDCIGDLAQNDAIQIAPQLNQPEDALIQAVIAAMPAAAQPPAISLDAGVDVYPYTFDNIGGGVKALSAITDVVVSAYGWVYCLATGTLRYESRHTRALKTSSFTFTELTHDDVVVPSALDNVYNRVRVTIHPRTIDPAATTVLCGATGAVLVGAGQTVTVWDTYRDQTNTLKLIGGSGFVTPIVAITDYLGNTASDGSGSDLTASISVATTTFAASAKFDITNSGGVDAYVTRRQLRGKGIYDNAPVTFESYIPMSYGDRPLDIDLPYQTDVTIAQAFAAYIATLFSALTNQADAVSFNPQRSDAVMTQALIRDIGDLITESETMTGMTSALLQIVGVEGAIEPGQILKMRYVVGWAGTGNVFIFDDAVHGVFDSALSPLGYA